MRPPMYSAHNGGEIVIEQYCSAAASRAPHPSHHHHRDTNVRCLKRWSIIYPVTSHCHNLTIRLERLDESQFLLWHLTAQIY